MDVSAELSVAVSFVSFVSFTSMEAVVGIKVDDEEKLMPP